MKKTTHKVLGLALALALTAGLLSGCGETYDPIQEAFGYPGSTVMMTVDGNDVKASDLFYWLAYNADYIAEYYSIMGGDINWDDTMGGTQPVKDYVKDEARQMAVLYSTVTAKTAAAGYTFDNDDPQYQEELDAAVANVGGTEAFTRFLKEMCLNDETFEKLNSVAVVYDHMREGICRKGGEYEPTEEELTQYIADNDLLAARHILLMTIDPETNQPLSEEEIAQKRTKAEELLAQLQAVDDPAQRSEKFSQLMKENSEDSGLSSNPDGYLFSAGQMVEEFENTTRALEIGGMSEIVESTYGYHIIMRDDPAQSESLLDGWSAEKMSSLTEQWVSEAEVVTTPEFDSLDIADFYAKLTAYRATLTETEEQEENAQTPEEGQPPADAQTPEEGQQNPADTPAPAEGEETPAAE